MNIILTPAIPGGYQYRQSPNINLDELTYLLNLIEEIHLTLKESAKHTPFITIQKLTGPMDQILASLKQITQNTPPSANCLIALGLNAAQSDGRYHSSRGWRVISNPESPQSSELATAMATAAIQTLGPRAIASQSQKPSLQHLNQTPILTARNIPAVLTLNLYQDNRQDAAYLLSSAGRRAITDLHVKGISAYLERLSQADSPATYPASSHHSRMHQ